MEQAGINLLHVPYKGGGEAVASVLSSTTDSYFSVPIECGPHIRAGKLIALGSSGHEAHAVVSRRADDRGERAAQLRHAALHVDARSRRHAAGHREQAVRERPVKAMQAPEVREKLTQNGDIAQGTLSEASELYAKEYKTWPGVVQKAGIKPT